MVENFLPHQDILNAYSGVLQMRKQLSFFQFEPAYNHIYIWKGCRVLKMSDELLEITKCVEDIFGLLSFRNASMHQNASDSFFPNI